MYVSFWDLFVLELPIWVFDGCCYLFDKMYSLIEGLESKDWVKVFESLNDARQFAMDKVMLVQVKEMKNPISVLCKTPIMAASDIFKSFGDKLFYDTTSDALD